VFALFGIDIADVLHGEQSFEYHRVPCAGEVLTIRRRIEDVYERKNGSLGFIVLRLEVTGEDDHSVCEAVQTIIVKQSSAAPA
jgi:acyl dehydratase